MTLRYSRSRERTRVDHCTPLALRLADLEDLTGADADHLAKLIGVDPRKYRRWALGQLRQVKKFENRCRHLEELAKTGLHLSLINHLDWQDGRIYWSLGNITRHRGITDAAKSAGNAVTDHSGPLVSWRGTKAKAGT